MDDSSAAKEQQKEVQEKESEADENNNSSFTLVQSSAPIIGKNSFSLKRSADLEINPLYVRQILTLVNCSC